MCPSGDLIVSCAKSYAIYIVTPATGNTVLIAGAGRFGKVAPGSALKSPFKEPCGLALATAQRLLYACDAADSRIFTLSLPEHLFQPSVPAIAASVQSTPTPKEVKAVAPVSAATPQDPKSLPELEVPSLVQPLRTPNSTFYPSPTRSLALSLHLLFCSRLDLGFA